MSVADAGVAPPRTPEERWQIEATLGMLAGGRWVAALSILLAIAATPVAMLPVWGGRAAVAVAGLIVLLGLAQCYFALRLAIDARLLRALVDVAGTTGLTAPLAALDRALQSLGWLPPEKVGRPLAPRLQGIARLVRWQSGVTLAQAACVPLVGWMGRL